MTPKFSIPMLSVLCALCLAQSSASAQDSSVSRTGAAIGDFGLDLSARKTSVKPGDDFFSFANGKWYDTFTIPEDRTSYGIFVVLDDNCAPTRARESSRMPPPRSPRPARLSRRSVISMRASWILTRSRLQD